MSTEEQTSEERTRKKREDADVAAHRYVVDEQEDEE